MLSRSNTIRRWLARKTPISNDDIHLYAKIVKKSATIFENRYRGKVIIILWTRGDNLSKKMHQALLSEELTVFKTEDILLDFISANSKYRIHAPYENHPNAFANRKIAEFLAQYLAK